MSEETSKRARGTNAGAGVAALAAAEVALASDDAAAFLMEDMAGRTGLAP